MLILCSVESKTKQRSTGRVVTVGIAIVSARVEHARIRTIVVIAPTFEPGITGVREVRVIRLNTYINLVTKKQYLITSLYQIH
mgnify:CR=1 FL=1